MVAMTRAPLGLALQSAIMPGDQPTFPRTPHGLPQTGQPEKPGFFKEGGMGRVIAGLIGDALLQQGGMRPVYSPMMQQRQALAQEEAQWSRRREVENDDWMARQRWERDNPAPSPLLRDIAAWQGLTPEQQVAFGAMQDAKAGPVTTTLPNGQLYIGPKSGIAAALGGPAPSAPVGKLTPISGGGVSNGTGGF